MESISLARAQKRGWVTDLVLVLRGLPEPVLLDVRVEWTPELIDDLLAALKTSLEKSIQDKLQQSTKTMDMIRGQKERGRDGKLETQVLAFRHYLRVKSEGNRRALTKMIWSGHSLASERMRWSERYRVPVPENWRLCRFCRTCIEDPV